MDVARPHRAVVTTLDGDVLVLLAGTTRPLSGRRIASQLGTGSQEGIRRSLDRLVEQGIVVREDAGSAYLHVLNRQHVAADAVLAIAGIRTELWHRLTEAFEAWEPPPVHASAFGSAARGDGDSDSDIDLFLVRPTAIGEESQSWRALVDTLRTSVFRWTGNRLGVVEHDEADIPALIQRSPAVLDDLKRDALDLFGVPLRKLLRPSRATA